MPRSYTWKRARQENHRPKLKQEGSSQQHNLDPFKVLLDWDLFVYRVDASTAKADFLDNLKSQSVTTMYKSNKLTVGLSDYNKMFNDSFWPPVVLVRRYVPCQSE